MTRKILLVAVLAALCSWGTSWASGMVKIGESVVVEEGVTVEDAVVVWGDLAVNGTVTGDAVVVGGDLKIGPSGRVDGDTVAVFGKVVRGPGSESSGKSFELSLANLMRRGGWMLPLCVIPLAGICTLGAVSSIMAICLLALCLLIAIFFTTKIGKVSFYVETHPWKALYLGLVTFVLVMPITLFLAVSIIGLPLIPVLFIGLSAATLFGFTAMCQLVGLKLFRAVKRPGQPMLLEVFIGFIILGIVSLIPFIGWLANLAIWLMGLWAVIATRFGAIEK